MRKKRATKADRERMLEQDKAREKARAEGTPETADHSPPSHGPGYAFARGPKSVETSRASKWAWFDYRDHRQHEEALAAGLLPGDLVSVLVQTNASTLGSGVLPHEAVDIIDQRDEPMRLVSMTDLGFTLRDRFGDEHDCHWGLGLRYQKV